MLDAPKFKTSDVAQAARLPHATLRSYFKRGQFRQIGQKADAGLPTLFSERDAVLVSIASALIAVGLDASEAFEAGVSFAHLGTSDRLPGGLFDPHQRGDTYLLHQNGETRFVAAVDSLPLAHLRTDTGAIILCLNPIVARTRRALGIA